MINNTHIQKLCIILLLHTLITLVALHPLSEGSWSQSSLWLKMGGLLSYCMSYVGLLLFQLMKKVALLLLDVGYDVNDATILSFVSEAIASAS